MAIGLAEADAAVVVASRSLERAEDVARQLPGNCANHRAIQLDHLSTDSIASGFANAVKSAGQIDILVNNGHEATTKTWHDVTSEDFDVQLANATGYFQLAKELRDHAIDRNAPASIILLGIDVWNRKFLSGHVRRNRPGNPVAYQVLKGGIIQLARHLAVHWAVDQIRVNAISPGPFPSPTCPRRTLQAPCRTNSAPAVGKCQ